MCKWYKYKDRCPGCGTEFLRKKKQAFLACAICGVIVDVPAYSESDKESHIPKHNVDGEMVPITIEHFAEMERAVVEQIERLAS